jgi:hypothetical protein
MIKFPNYDKSILSITASVLKYYGASNCNHKTLKEFDTMLNKNFENVIVMLFDGMGVDAINNHLEKDSFLRKHFVCPISSVFPSTTVAATTTILSGYSPIEHAWLGWDLYFKELDDNISVFRNTYQKDETVAADYYIAGRYIPHKTIFNRIEKANSDIKTYCVTPFSNPKVNSLQEIENVVLDLVNIKGKKYIYVYHPQPDSIMHRFGVQSGEAKVKIKEINDFVEKLCSKLNDTLLVVTADHGLIDSETKFLEDYPEIWNLLKRPASIESRALSFFVKDGMIDKFKTEFNKCFGEKFLLLTKQEVYDKHLFGFGTPHFRADEFIGDYLGIAVSDLTLINYHEDNPFIGVHAGLDEREMIVPFIAVEKEKQIER